MRSKFTPWDTFQAVVTDIVTFCKSWRYPIKSTLMGLIPYSIESLCLNFALFTRWPQPLKRFHFENYFIYLRNTLKVFPFIHLGCLFYILICNFKCWKYYFYVADNYCSKCKIKFSCNSYRFPYWTKIN